MRSLASHGNPKGTEDSKAKRVKISPLVPAACGWEPSDPTQLPAGRAEEPSQNSQPPVMPVKLKDLQSLLAKPFRSRDE